MVDVTIQSRPVPDVLSPARLGPAQLRNRVIKAATYEHLAVDGKVTQELIDFHLQYARGGVGMTTLAYCAVSPDGRVDGDQLVWTPEALPGLRRLTDAVHAEGAAVSVQVGHSGPCGQKAKTGYTGMSASPVFFLAALRMTRSATAADLDRVVEAHRRAGQMAVEAGFDAIEVHLGHNYLVSSFLSPRLNRRDDEYGGSLANRARLALRVMQAVRDGAQDRIAITAKMNMDDGKPGGFWIDEAAQVAQWLEAAGTVDALEMTAGSSFDNPMYIFRGDTPRSDISKVVNPVRKMGLRFVGSRVIKSYPYQDGYLLEDARQIRAAVKLPMILLGGVTDAAMMDRAMAEGFDFVAMGRALLREPDLVNQITRDRAKRSLCNHCNKCVFSSLVRTRCVFVPDQGSIAGPVGG